MYAGYLSDLVSSRYVATLTNGSDRMSSESFFDCSVDVGRFQGSGGLSGITCQETLEQGDKTPKRMHRDNQGGFSL